MSADDFVDQYWNVQTGSTTISINKYLIGGRFAGAGADSKLAQQQRVYSLATQNGLGPKASVFARARNGKVSPDDCTHILTLAVQSGAVKESELQKWADANLGVDCTGFAVAYYDDLGLIDIERYSGGASCLYLFDKAKRNHNASDDGPLIWSIEDVESDDMILWMYENGVESKSPGHISIVYDVDEDRAILCCAESNGANDGQGHWGPKLTERTWGGEKSVGGRRCINLDRSDVIVVRPPDQFG
jgi:hypothetical protein